MRIATVTRSDGSPVAAVVRDGHALPVHLPDGRSPSVRALAADPALLDEVRAWSDERSGARSEEGWRPLGGFVLGPVVPDPGAIYTIGLNYRAPGEPDAAGPDRPLVYGKAASAVAPDGARVSWDRARTANVDAECELGIVIGTAAHDVPPDQALHHVLGYTIVNDISSRDPWLDGDQWLIGKSMPGFAPVGPWLVTADALDPSDLRLGCTINGEAIQDGRTSQMRFGIAEIVSYLSRHLVLRPGDIIASGTPARLATPPGPDRHLEPGDLVRCWIEGIGELTTVIE